MTTGKAGRPIKITGDNVEKLRQLAVERPDLSLRKLTALFVENTKVEVSFSTVRAVLAQQGVTRRRVAPNTTSADQDPEPATRNVKESSDEPPRTARRYGYSNDHRSDRDERRRYPSSLTDAEWALVEDLFINTGPGQPPEYERRDIVEACSYIVRSGCSWRMLPKEFPPWQNVYAHFRRWDERGLFTQMHERLRGMWREREGRNTEASAAILDSQSVKTGPQGGEKGYDAGKKVKGRKRHLVVDFLGLLLAVLILPANVQDRDAAVDAVRLACQAQPSIRALIVDGAYAGRCAEQLEVQCGVEVEVIKRPSKVQTCVDGKPLIPPPKAGFVPLPKRWIVERTNAWNLSFRRLVVDHDRLPQVSAAWIWFAQSTMLMRRLASKTNT